ncbi:MAG: hypothetical protein LBD17_02720 [Endomicrobium sp.]|jgi:hypothetical protein|nr:hypothetical protein [Endomicrobium sp.]
MNKTQEEIVDILCKYTNVENKTFFRVVTAYKLASVVSSLRVNVSYLKTNRIPLNVYAIALANSGFSKGKSINMLNLIFKPFEQILKNRIFPDYSKINIQKLANMYSMKYGRDYNAKLLELKELFHNSAKYIYEFPISTVEGVRSLRNKLSVAGVGATNMSIDEIGSVLTNQNIRDTITYGLETYDLGKTTPKLLKYNSEESLDINVPNNILMFGTAYSLFDGSETENLFFEFLSTGYARRCLFAVENNKNEIIKPAEERYDEIFHKDFDERIESLKNKFSKFANEKNINKEITIDKETSIFLLDYENKCKEKTFNFKKNEILQSTELKHRYWKVLKLAGIYAFIDYRDHITIQDITEAIELVEDSGKNFETIIKTDPNYIKLAKFFEDNQNQDMTSVDLCEKLMFYKNAKVNDKKHIMDMAITYGYKNGIFIERKIINNIEFFNGRKYDSNNLENIILSFSKNISENYRPYTIKWDKLYLAVTKEDSYFTVHHFKDNKRKSDNIIQGFNMLVIDIDKDLSIELFKEIMQDYKYLLYTTKSNTDEQNRFRVCFPIDYTIKLNTDEYRAYYERFIDWLPFDIDNACKDIARTWRTNSGTYFYNDGKLIDCMIFLPNSKKYDKYKNDINNYKDMESIEKWFLVHMEDGNRNSMLYRYAAYLLNINIGIEDISKKVYELNSKLKDGLSESEIDNTIIKSIERKLNGK